MDILIALIPAIAWGSIGLIAGKLGGNFRQQTLGMTMGAFIIGLLSLFIFTPYLSTATWIIGLISGLFWVLGQSMYFQSFYKIGVSKTVPMTGLQLIVNTMVAVLIFQEWQTNRDYLLGSTAIILLILGAIFTAYEEKQIMKKENSKGYLKFLPLLISTVGFVLYTIIVRYGQVMYDVESTAVILPQAVGMLIGALCICKKKDIIERKTRLNILTGLTWAIGNLFMFIAMEKVGLATSFSLSQAGIVISTLGGIFILKEANTKRELFLTVIGCFLIIIGGTLLGMVK
ncbi:glucose transporter GlcU [Listeria ivanovii]|uniref:GRP family sugar transporter n=1 Tax=Listeria ivanovii TaxID=1638 RepID=UPI000DA913B5|nr:GRP family sugar transporter [Listeria ivanovii]PZG52329.1 glucose transporter GlcU [Listeria ivanovii]